MKQQAEVTTPAVDLRRLCWDRVERRPGTIFGSGAPEAPAQEHMAAASVLFASRSPAHLTRKTSDGELAKGLLEPVSKTRETSLCITSELDAQCLQQQAMHASETWMLRGRQRQAGKGETNGAHCQCRQQHRHHHDWLQQAQPEEARGSPKMSGRRLWQKHFQRRAWSLSPM